MAKDRHEEAEVGAGKWQVQDTNAKANTLLFQPYRCLNEKLSSDNGSQTRTILISRGHLATPGDISD